MKVANTVAGVSRFTRGTRAVCECFEALMAQRADDIAVVVGSRSLTFGDLDRRSLTLLLRLLELGVQSGSRIGIVPEPVPEMIIALIACLRMGAAVTILTEEDVEGSGVLSCVFTSGGARLWNSHLNITFSEIGAMGVRILSAPAWGIGTEAPVLRFRPAGRITESVLTHGGLISYFDQMDKWAPQDTCAKRLNGSSAIDILSLVEALWAICRGGRVILPEPEWTMNPGDPKHVDDLQFSLFYFSSNEAEFKRDKYRLVIEGAKFADEQGFAAIWVPERHFHAFGGLYPNPATLAAALAMITRRVRLRAGSVVLPLHQPIRVAEEWAVVDNLSDGRVDIAFARGWNPNDFALSPDNYADSLRIMHSGIDLVRKLWRGESIRVPNGIGESTDIRIYPLPQQGEPGLWITCSGGMDRFIEAGESGTNLLTALLFQSIDELALKIAAYREARVRKGHGPGGCVTLMLHTFLGHDEDSVRNAVRQPLIQYLESSVDLWRGGSERLEELDHMERDGVLQYAFDRYYRRSGLFGTPEKCIELVRSLQKIGVNEIACLIDFGLPVESVLEGLESLNDLRRRTNPASPQSSVGDSIVRRPARLAGDGAELNASARYEFLQGLSDEHVISAHPPKSDEQRIREWKLMCKLTEIVVGRISAAIGWDPGAVPHDRMFSSFGLDSLKALQLMPALENELGIALSPSVLFDYPTVRELVNQLAINEINCEPERSS